jgi:hypothetical protein
MIKSLSAILSLASLVLLPACSLPTVHLPKLKHDASTFLDQQKELLQADNFDIAASTSSFQGKSVSYLTIQIVNAKALPNPADSSAAAVKRVARRVVAELSNPTDYQVVQVGVKQQQGVAIVSTTQQQTFSYSLVSLQ